MRKKAGFIIFLIVGIYLIIQLSRDLWQILGVRGRISEAEGEVKKLEVEKIKLEEDLKLVQSEAYIEQAARDKLLLGKEGEAVVMVGEQPEVQQVQQVQQVVQGDQVNWRKWLRVFGW